MESSPPTHKAQLSSVLSTPGLPESMTVGKSLPCLSLPCPALPHPAWPSLTLPFQCLMGPYLSLSAGELVCTKQQFFICTPGGTVGSVCFKPVESTYYISHPDQGSRQECAWKTIYSDYVCPWKHRPCNRNTDPALSISVASYPFSTMPHMLYILGCSAPLVLTPRV